MTITYDKRADALYIGLLEGQHQCRVVQLSADFALDFTGNERLVGIEVLGASRLFENPESPTIDLRALIPHVAV